MEPKKNCCGFGKTFAENQTGYLKPFKSFYKPGAVNSLYLTQPIRNCESLVYGEKIIRSPFRFGKGNKLNVKLVKSVTRDIKYLK